MSTSHNMRLSTLWAYEISKGIPYGESVKEVAEALQENDGNITAAAAFLHIGKATLYRYMEERPILHRVRDAALHEAREQAKRVGRTGT
jgi:DNA-binding NtrC family response regulator